MRRIMRNSVVSVAIAAAAVVGLATTASAQNYVITGAYGYYDPNKHMFGIGDTEADGQYPYVQWKINGVSQGDLVNYNGNGSWRDVTISSGKWGQSLAWRICRSGGGGCSPWLYETA
ncbi:hypothetical protein ATKI12_8182 [Kitasatospora sp. Ki12]|uniref:hypothetical protein n=1 Tax=Kitasatospora xanthocidica TaxID=83382 RepID=UPI0016768534|nr:hypothetical protein [Kitasatospora xanthocidica]GHF83100.1 hypothetical protein GCM10018790_71070 [Kitasatospora xanthocidica]